MLITWGVVSDHRGVELKKALAEHLGAENVTDFGAYENTRVDASDMMDKAIHALKSGDVTHIVAICGTGIAMNIRANRYKGVRASILHDELSATRAKEHNNLNVLCFGSDVIDEKQAVTFLNIFNNASFLGTKDARYAERNNKMDEGDFA